MALINNEASSATRRIRCQRDTVAAASARSSTQSLASCARASAGQFGPWRRPDQTRPAASLCRDQPLRTSWGERVEQGLLRRRANDEQVGPQGSKGQLAHPGEGFKKVWIPCARWGLRRSEHLGKLQKTINLNSLTWCDTLDLKPLPVKLKINVVAI